MTISTRRLLRLAGRALALLALALQAAPLPAQEAPRRPRVGLALGGGGAKGIAHVGVLRWFEEHRIPIDVIAGTSMGGLVGGAYATGMTAAEIELLLRDADWDLIMKPDAPYSQKAYRRKEDARQYPVKLELGLKHGVQLPSGLNPGHHIGVLLSRLTLPYSRVEDFDLLPIPFRCVAVDMRRGTDVVLGEGSLATALRATMAIPGVFDPVRLGDQLLSDGGVLDNVPVDVARKLGADVVIAVKVGSPQFDEVSESILGLADRAISLMMERLSDPRVAEADVLVFPQLRGFTGTDWAKTGELVPLGYAAAEAQSEALLKLALEPQAWEAHLAERRARARVAPEKPDFIEVTGVSERAAKGLSRYLAYTTKRAYSLDRFEVDLSRIVGVGRYSAAGYGLAERDGQQGLRVRVREKTYAPPFLGFFVDVSNQQEDVDFNFGVRATFMDMARYGSELRVDGTFGSNLGISGEWLIPVGGRGFFLAPRGFASRSKINVYEDEELVANYQRERSGGGADLGWLIGSKSQLRVGYVTDHLSDSLRIGDPALPQTSGREAILNAVATLDSADQAIIPGRGVRLEGRIAWFLEAPTAEREFGLMTASASSFHPAKGHDTLFVSATGEAVLGPEPPELYRPALGGLMQLSGFGTDELRGRYTLVGRAAYLHSLAKLPDLLGDRLFLMGVFELGSAFDEVGTAQVKFSAGGALVADTFFGPIYFGAAVGNSGSVRFYTTIGRLFP